MHTEVVYRLMDANHSSCGRLEAFSWWASHPTVVGAVDIYQAVVVTEEL